jgi:hypothetical protein
MGLTIFEIIFLFIIAMMVLMIFGLYDFLKEIADNIKYKKRTRCYSFTDRIRHVSTKLYIKTNDIDKTYALLKAAHNGEDCSNWCCFINTYEQHRYPFIPDKISDERNEYIDIFARWNGELRLGDVYHIDVYYPSNYNGPKPKLEGVIGGKYEHTKELKFKFVSRRHQGDNYIYRYSLDILSLIKKRKYEVDEIRIDLTI